MIRLRCINPGPHDDIEEGRIYTATDITEEGVVIVNGEAYHKSRFEEVFRPTEREQKLVDICFQLAIMVHCDERFAKRGVEGVAEYVASQLKQCGFPTHPVGMSWGVLDQ